MELDLCGARRSASIGRGGDRLVSTICADQSRNRIIEAGRIQSDCVTTCSTDWSGERSADRVLPIPAFGNWVFVTGKRGGIARSRNNNTRRPNQHDSCHDSYLPCTKPSVDDHCRTHRSIAAASTRPSLAKAPHAIGNEAIPCHQFDGDVVAVASASVWLCCVIVVIAASTAAVSAGSA